ncbi:hypothetical protein [Streptomyces avermitilis]|uniref:hypothetical protein n=1 Tax=Streptomyces avermitilis TaxID=33903 RepID=UPI0033D55BCA
MRLPIGAWLFRPDGASRNTLVEDHAVSFAHTRTFDHLVERLAVVPDGPNEAHRICCHEHDCNQLSWSPP